MNRLMVLSLVLVELACGNRGFGEEPSETRRRHRMAVEVDAFLTWQADAARPDEVEYIYNGAKCGIGDDGFKKALKMIAAIPFNGELLVYPVRYAPLEPNAAPIRSVPYRESLLRDLQFDKGFHVIQVSNAKSLSQVDSKRLSDTLKQAQGEWVVESSTVAGAVFHRMRGLPILIEGDTISWVQQLGRGKNGKPLWIRMRKKVLPKPEISELAVDLLPDFPEGKAWSRVGIMEIKDDELHLCVNFPQNPRPEEFRDADDGRECVVMRRVTHRP